MVAANPVSFTKLIGAYIEDDKEDDKEDHQ
jgi:hypothetical protein